MISRKTKKRIILNIPYVIIGALGTNIGEAWRIASGTDIGGKIRGMVTGGTLAKAFDNPMPSVHPRDIITGIIIGAAIKLAVYAKSKNKRGKTSLLIGIPHSPILAVANTLSI